MITEKSVLKSKVVQLKFLANAVAVVVINTPGEKVNTLSLATMHELSAVLDRLSRVSPADVQGVVFISGKTDNFIAGADIEEIAALQNKGEDVGYNAAAYGKSVFAKIEALHQTTVAAIAGVCQGGGTELALACDFRIASSNAKTKIGLPEVKLGFIPGWGGTVRLPHLIGMAAALDVITGLRSLDAHTAWKLGVVDEVCQGERLFDRAQQIALTGKALKHSFKRFCEKTGDLLRGEHRVQRLVTAVLERNAHGRKLIAKQAAALIKSKTNGNYPAAARAVPVILKSLNGQRKDAFDAESIAFAQLAVSSVSRSLVGIWATQKDTKRSPADFVPAIVVRKVGVLGSGTMGSGITQTAALAGFPVVLKDINAEALKRGMDNIRRLFDELVQKGKLTAAAAAERLAAIVPTTDYQALADCDLVIEAVLEVMSEKEACLAALDQVISKPYLFATNTSSLSVSEIARSAKHPENVVGLHFFNPVPKMELVEVVRGEKSSEEALAIVRAFSVKLGKTPVTTGDAHGFVVNRILVPYMLEAMRLLDDGVPPADIDKAMTKFGMPMGPLALLDEVGLDIAAHVVNTLNQSLGERMSPPAILASLRSLKLLGKKGGRGIYLYEGGRRLRDEKKKEVFNPDVLSALGSRVNAKQLGEIQSRLVLVMVNEAALLLQEGVIGDHAQLDLAMVLGTGFAPQIGGPLHYADRLGLDVVYQNLTNLARVAGDNYKPCQLLATMAANGERFFNN